MVSAHVCCVSLDNNGNLLVKTEYTLPDGFKLSKHTRYNYRTFSREKIQQDIETHCETLIIRMNMLKRHTTLAQTKVDDLSCSKSSAQLLIRPPEFDKDGAIVKPALYETVTDSI